MAVLWGVNPSHFQATRVNATLGIREAEGGKQEGRSWGQDLLEAGLVTAATTGVRNELRKQEAGVRQCCWSSGFDLSWVSGKKGRKSHSTFCYRSISNLYMILEDPCVLEIKSHHWQHQYPILFAACIIIAKRTMVLITSSFLVFLIVLTDLSWSFPKVNS